jgi:hypothetical protein
MSLSTQPRPDSASENIIDIVSIIKTMKRQESMVYKTLPYLENIDVLGSEHLENPDVSANDRKKLCPINASNTDRHLATVAITYFDRFLSRRGLRSVEACLTNEREFQLAYVVSWWPDLARMFHVSCTHRLQS